MIRGGSHEKGGKKGRGSFSRQVVSFFGYRFSIHLKNRPGGDARFRREAFFLCVASTLGTRCAPAKCTSFLEAGSKATSLSG